MIVHNSNVADAIRCALGENNARILRAKKNEELIFGGSETRKSLGMAEAILQLDNTSRRLPIEFTKVEVGRRLFRNGDAEYLVNRSRVRLRDLQDLLAGEPRRQPVRRHRTGPGRPDPRAPPGR